MNRLVLMAGVCAAALTAGAALAQTAPAQISDDKVKIAVLNDMAGVYADPTGMGSVEAVRMAVEEMGGKVAGKPVEVIFADHQNKPDVGASLANKWIDTEQVDVIVDVPTSSVALAVQEITRQKNRVFLISGGGAAQLTGPACSPTTAHWTYDTYALAQGMGTAGPKMLGDSWYFLTVDYAFGHALERDVSEVLKANGAKVAGAVRHPLNTADFSSFLLQAQSSQAKVIALANAGGDTVNSIKQAQEFGLTQGGQTLASMLMFPTDIHSLGLQAAQGLVLTDGWNPDRDEESRAFVKAYMARTGRMPSMIQAGSYSAVRHYLKAIAAAGTDEAKAVMAKMRETPVNDAFTKGGTLRIDGRMVHDMYLMQVKTPAESKGPWDYYKVLTTIPGEQAYRPLDKGGCPLAK
ncbi:ABC transporter substrate-binding protein [Azospirillum thermophilum]|uniref:ABC transporter permease n=1 Tax=Azospirillum thermophilum TaxID=2202148 RepID=A0A2S2CYC7_9PROT|nr:ABC transporter substrate-binding protein [Azospirillum thermophilum]AWK89491.1 ABC transporter permease [Azospirillum thermophilum]